jgi:hypothetical protein
MTRDELAILGPVASHLCKQTQAECNSLRYETQFGSCFAEFPYHPAAIDLESYAKDAIHSLPREQKNQLVACWRRSARLISITPPEAIIDRYAVMLIDILVRRARAAGARTSNWS